MSLTPKGRSSLLRFLKVTACGVVVLVADAAVTFATGNSLGLAPTYQSIVMALGVPALAGVEKWATWQEAQP